MPLADTHVARLKQLMAEMHSFACLIDQIERASKKSTSTEELEKLSKSIAVGMDVAFDLTRQLNRAALALHIELLSRGRKP